MRHKLKIILSYWRLPLVLLIVLLAILYLIGTGADISGAVSAVCLFLVFPGFIFAFFRAVFLSVRNTVRFNRTQWPETVSHPVVNALESVVFFFSEEISTFRSLAGRMRWRFAGFRILAVILSAGGIVFIFISLPVIGTLVLIAGVTLWILANPNTFNDRVDGVRMVPCPSGCTEKDLFEKLRRKSSPLGTPVLAKLRQFKKPVILYGPDGFDNMVVVYHAPRTDCFYISDIYSPGMIESRLTEAEFAGDEPFENDVPDEYATLLGIITGIVEAALPGKDEPVR